MSASAPYPHSRPTDGACCRAPRPSYCTARDANAVCVVRIIFRGASRGVARRAASGVRTVGPARPRARARRSAEATHARVRAAATAATTTTTSASGVGRISWVAIRIGASRARCAARGASVAGTRFASLIFERARARVGAKKFRAGHRRARRR